MLSLKLINKQQIMSKEIDRQKVTDNDCYTLLSTVFDDLFETIDDYAYQAAVNNSNLLKGLKKVERKKLAIAKLKELVEKNCR